VCCGCKISNDRATTSRQAALDDPLAKFLCAFARVDDPDFDGGRLTRAGPTHRPGAGCIDSEKACVLLQRMGTRWRNRGVSASLDHLDWRARSMLKLGNHWLVPQKACVSASRHRGPEEEYKQQHVRVSS